MQTIDGLSMLTGDIKINVMKKITKKTVEHAKEILRLYNEQNGIERCNCCGSIITKPNG